MNIHTPADAIACLRSVGLPVTQQRIEITRVLFAQPVHLTADQVLERVRVHAPETSRATVYNTLRLFCEKKLVRELIETGIGRCSIPTPALITIFMTSTQVRCPTLRVTRCR